MPRVAVVIPCYNEAERLDPERIQELVSGDDLVALVVDDGSSDGTLEVLSSIARQHPDKVEVLALPQNCGKGEAVRAGMLAAALKADVVGYCDADFSTPPSEMLRLVALLEELGADVVTGARIARLGADIDRRTSRHYLGRVFATAAALALGRQVYDTQCGAKIFRKTDALEAALSEPFVSKWAFDVELLGRLLGLGSSVVEVPLGEWRDIGGSKLGGMAAVRAGIDLVQIAWALRRWR